MLARDLLEPEEVEQLMAACEDSPSGLRDRALIALMAATGVRVSEALAVLPRDLDLRRRRLHVRRGKGGLPRHVWVHPDAAVPIGEWMAERNRLGLADAPLFCSLRGSRMDASYVRRAFPRLGEIAGIKKRVHSHALRHAFACKAHLANVSMRTLQLQMGHRDLSSTSRYLERLNLEDVFADFDRALT